VTDIYAFQTTMKMTWLRKIVSSNGKCFQLVYSMFDVEKMFNLGKNYIEKIMKSLKNCFWRDVLTCYIEYINKQNVSKCEDILDMPLFYNHNFKIGMNIIYNKNMYDKGIRYVRDILCTSGEFLKQSVLENLIGAKINFLFYEGLLRTVKAFIRVSGLPFIQKPNIQCAFISSYLNNIVFGYNQNKLVYQVFSYNTDIPTCHSKWNTLFNNVEWKKVHALVFIISRDTYTQWFQTRIVHRILGTKSLLFKMNIVHDNLCSFCNENEETILHIFWDCIFTKRIVNYVVEFLRSHNVQKCTEISCQTMLFGCTSTNMTDINILILEIKKYIFVCQRKGKLPSIRGLNNYFCVSYEIQYNTKYQEKELPNWLIVKLFVDQ